MMAQVEIFEVARTVAEIIVAVVVTPLLTYVAIVLHDIKVQTTRTNGRVTQHDIQLAELQTWKSIHDAETIRQLEADAEQRKADDRQREADQRLRDRAHELLLAQQQRVQS